MRVQICNRQKSLELPAEQVRRLLRTGLEQEGADAELSVALVEEQEMKRLNRRFTAREGSTDVLAFPYGVEDGVLHGEIVVNADRAIREAAERPHDAEDELLLYVAHGLLHLLGYGDHEAEERETMRRREAEMLAAVGRRVEY
jgi:probable rRNA maturation factor